ncbi:MAG: hypothetical protein JWM21_2765 [Acidobacteria bacterium]|nr:hypothetical protein [Acidobacteriota bacterium]
MSESRLEQSLARRNESVKRTNHKSGGLSVWSLFGGAALVLMAAAVLVNLPDIKRYIKISTM